MIYSILLEVEDIDFFSTTTQVNKSFDKTEYHDYGYDRGQPSVVWKGTVYVGGDNSNNNGVIIGHGHVAGADDSINTDLSTMTTALNLITSVDATSNISPSINTTSLTDATINNEYNFSIQMNDIDSGDTHTFELLEKPAWLSIGSSTGVLTGTPVIDDVGNNIPVVVRVTDSGTPSFSDTLTTSIDVMNSFPSFVDENIQSEFKVSLPYPNPFNPQTTISYELSHPEKVTISVYNALGQRVKVYEIGYIDKGSHEIVFDAAGLTSGLYFYSIDAGYASVTGKMLYMK